MTPDDSSIAPDDPAYRERMERLLDETEYDTELGLEMAEDAQRLVAGEITEEEFYEQYHEAVLTEFGEDQRGLEMLAESYDVDAAEEDLENGGDGPLAALESLAEDGDLPRREVLKKGGAAAAFLSLGIASAKNERAAAAGAPEDDDGTQWGMVINLNNCDGCLACMVACQQENNTSRGANWMYVFTYEDEGQGDENFLVRPCQHCSDAPCEKVCPVGARHTRDKDGLVLTDYDICIGCRYCQVSCPYGVNYFQWGEPDTPYGELDEGHTHDERGKWVDSRPPQGVMGKCTMCPSRQDGHRGEDKIGTTACEDACTMDAIHFGNVNDPESAPNQHLEQYKSEQTNDLETFKDRKDHTVSTFKLLEERGTEPNVTYVGNEPSPHAEQVDGPVTYEDVGLVDNRQEEVLADGAAANEGGEEA